MKRHIIASLAALGFASSANAQTPEDVQVIVDNLPNASVALIEGVADISTTLIETSSAVETSAAAGSALRGVGGALLSGSPSFGAIPLGLLLVNFKVQDAVAPFAEFIDDPNADTFNSVFNPDDLGTIAANLATVPDAAYNGKPFSIPFQGTFETGLKDATVSLLKGDFTNGATGNGVPSVSASSVFSVISVTNALLEDTNYGEGSADFGGTLAAISLAPLGAAAPNLEPLEESLAPLYEALEPLTTPAIAAIEASDVPEVPEF